MTRAFHEEKVCYIHVWIFIKDDVMNFSYFLQVCTAIYAILRGSYVIQPVYEEIHIIFTN